MSAYLTSLLILFFSIIPGVFNRNDSCCDWEVYESAGSNQGCVQPDINTEYACKMTCMGNAECFSFGWNGRAIRDNCALFYRPTRLEPGWEGDRQWVINRMGYCEVPCIYAFSARCGKYALNGVVRKSVAETKDCKLACMNETGCTGFDWWPLNDTDRRCLLNFRPSPLHDGSSSLHYEYMRTLCYMPTADYKISRWFYVTGVTLVSLVLSVSCYSLMYFSKVQSGPESKPVPATAPTPQAAPTEASHKVPSRETLASQQRRLSRSRTNLTNEEALKGSGRIKEVAATETGGSRGAHGR